MSMKTRVATFLLIGVLLASAPMAAAQAADQADAWRTLAMRLEPGAEVKMRLHNGQQFRATLLGADADAVVIQPKTRRTVPVQRLGYAAIAAIERPRPGMGAAKAVLIGVSTGAAAGFAVLMMLVAAYSD